MSISFTDSNHYWKKYMKDFFGEHLIDFWETVVKEEWIVSNNNKIHLEIYNTGDSNAPTLIFSHGIAGYARLLLPFIEPLYKKGYNVVAPDLTGYGYNRGKRGKFEFNQLILDLHNSVLYAKQIFKGKILLGGASMGGPLAYSTASRYGGIDALVCWCLWDLNDKEFIQNETTMKNWTIMVTRLLKKLKKIIGNFRIKSKRIIPYEGLSTPEIVDLISKDPHSGIKLTINAALSLLTQSIPDIPFENWDIPTLIFHPEKDTMIPTKYSKRIYDIIASKKKNYIEVKDSIHFPVKDEHYNVWAEEFNAFIKNII